MVHIFKEDLCKPGPACSTYEVPQLDLCLKTTTEKAAYFLPSPLAFSNIIFGVGAVLLNHVSLVEVRGRP